MAGWQLVTGALFAAFALSQIVVNYFVLRRLTALEQERRGKGR
jgi:hypothetical protein